MRTLDYLLLDVFTRTPLEGNQLAVVLDGRGLSTTEMQALARETNLSETTYILPGEGKDGAHRVRIFTVDEELPFAGHPTLGTATALLGQNPGAQEIVLDLNAGRVPVRFENRDGMAFGEMRQLDPTFGQTHEAAAVAPIAGLTAADIDTRYPIQTANTGMGFAIVPLASVDALRRMHFDWKVASDYLVKSDAKFFYFIARDPSQENAIEARMIFYNGEDPATGSAAGCCAAWCVKHGYVAPETQAVIHQGRAVRRPSQLYIRASLSGSSVSNVRVGGYTVHVGRGTFQIP